MLKNIRLNVFMRKRFMTLLLGKNSCGRTLTLIFLHFKHHLSLWQQLSIILGQSFKHLLKNLPSIFSHFLDFPWSAKTALQPTWSNSTSNACSHSWGDPLTVSLGQIICFPLMSLYRFYIYTLSNFCDLSLDL